jgi:DNA polymerase-3 subunit beta
MSEVKQRERKPRAAKAAPVQATSDLMEIRVGNKTFAAALARAAGFVTRGGTLPILNCVALTAGGGRLTIESSNLEQALRQTITITGVGVGGGCVDWDKLASVIRRLPPEGDTTLEFAGAALVVRSGATRVTITLWPLSDFPVFSLRPDKTTEFVMSAATLADMLARVHYAISQEQTRFYLCGVSLNVRGEEDEARMRAASTNGNELAVIAVPVPPGADGMPDIIVPAPAADELERLLRGADTVDLSITEAALVATVGEMVLLTKLIAATFPDYLRVIPPAGPHVLTVNGKALVEVIELAALFSREEKKKPWVRLSMSKDRVGVTGGEGNDQIVSELPEGSFTYTGDKATIAFNAASLIEPAKLAKGRLVFGFNASAPFLVSDEDDASVTYVSGPLRA